MKLGQLFHVKNVALTVGKQLKSIWNGCAETVAL